MYKIKADSVLLSKDTCPAELNIENRTKDTLGFLYNKGNGRTEFRRGAIRLTDSTYLFGNDIINFKNVISSLGITGSTNIYNTNGSLTSNRFLNLDASTLSIGKGASTNFHLFNNGNLWLGQGTPVASLGGLHLRHIVSATSNNSLGVLLNDSLIATSNNDTLVALDINPSYNLNGNTSVFPIDLRTKNANVVFGSGFGYGRFWGNSNDGIVQIRSVAATQKTQIILRPAGNPGGNNGNWWGVIEQEQGGKLSILSPNYGSGLFLQTPGISGGVTIGGYSSANAIYIPSTTRNILIGTNTDDSTSILKIVSTTKGVILPNWSQSQRLAIDGITTPGLIGYQSNAGGNTENLYLYKSTGWKRVLTEDDNTSNGQATTTYILASNFSNSTTTLNPVTGLSFALQGGTSYKIEFRGLYQTAATTTGITLGVDGTGDFIGEYSIAETNTASASGLNAVISSNASVITSAGVNTANTSNACSLQLILHCTSNSTFNIRFASEVAGSNATLMAKSTLIITRL